MLQGGCCCGAVRYATDDAPYDETVCHCGDCRRAVGATAVAWFTVPADGLRLTAGQPRTFPSSPGVTRSFCGDCGTSLFYARDPEAEVDVTTASLDDPDAVPPKDHVHAASRPRWAVIADGLPVHSGARASA